MGDRKAKGDRPHRGWDTPTSAALNVVIILVILALSIKNAADGRWVFAAIGLGILVVCGLLPGWSAWKAGQLGRRPEPTETAEPEPIGAAEVGGPPAG